MNLELDAAQALLELRGGRHIFQNGYNNWSGDGTNEEEPTTISRLFNSLMTSRSLNREAASTSTSKRELQSEDSRPAKKPKTCDQNTQTDFETGLPEIEKMESIIRELCGKIGDLETQLKGKSPETASVADTNNSEQYSDTSSEAPLQQSATRRSYRRRRTCTNTTPKTESSDELATPRRRKNRSDPEFKISKADSSVKKPLKPKNTKPNDNEELISLGRGNVVLPVEVMDFMDWSSYTYATRKLLTAVFPRRVLATHSLTGKRSPAFPDKPAKKKLDPLLVNDIVQTVVERCNVPENVVRTSITTKCADESKMYRSRQLNKLKKKALKKENISPSDETGDSCYSS